VTRRVRCGGTDPRSKHVVRHSAPISREPERSSRSDSSRKKSCRRVSRLFLEIFRLNSLDGHPRSRGHALILSFFYLPLNLHQPPRGEPHGPSGTANHVPTHGSRHGLQSRFSPQYSKRLDGLHDEWGYVISRRGGCERATADSVVGAHVGLGRTFRPGSGRISDHGGGNRLANFRCCSGAVRRFGGLNGRCGTRRRC
jgi:hypothetical protein